MNATAEEALDGADLLALQGQAQLIFTSPPFPLHKKKRYDNKQGEEYLEWLKGFGPLFRKILHPTGSIVIELGNTWEPGKPVMSTLAVRALLAFQSANELHLCQEFICHNPARIPGPAQWVTVERIRLKDSYTRLWWLSPVDRPKANNRSVLQPYGPSMRKLLSSGKYNAGRRPSEHYVSERGFATDHGGAIPPSVLTIANTGSTDPYLTYCREHKLPKHPARMPVPLAEFFIKFLTTESDLVVDPFAGSNTTGYAAEKLKRRWVSIERDLDYGIGSIGRFAANSVEVPA